MSRLAPLKRNTFALRIFPLFTLMGWLLMGFAMVVLAFALSATAASYWGGSAKEVRDVAAIGSGLLGQLTALAWWPKLLAPLAFLGVAMFMTGIALEFGAIPRLLDRRSQLLTQTVPLMGKED